MCGRRPAGPHPTHHRLAVATATPVVELAPTLPISPPPAPELVLADEVTRHETTSADRRSKSAGLDPRMTLVRWDDTARVTYDHTLWCRGRAHRRLSGVSIFHFQKSRRR